MNEFAVPSALLALLVRALYLFQWSIEVSIHIYPLMYTDEAKYLL